MRSHRSVSSGCTLALALLIALLAAPPRVSASEPWSDLQDSGSLRMRAADGSAGAASPLRHTEVRAELAGFTARVQVTQVFASPWATPVEAIYTFPLPVDAVVDELRIETAIRTADEAVVHGLELDLAVRPMQDLQLRSSLAFAHSRYADFDDPVDPRADAREGATPDLALRFSADYGVPIGTLGELHVSALWRQRSSRSNDALDTRELRSGRTGELDGSLALRLADGKTELALLGTNLLDRESIEGGTSFADSLGYAVRTFNEPRALVLQLRCRY